MVVALAFYYFPPIEGLASFVLFAVSLFLAFVSLSFLPTWLWWLIIPFMFYLFSGLCQRRFINRQRFSQIFIFLLLTLSFVGFVLNYVNWLILALVLFFGALLLFNFSAEINSLKRLRLFAGIYTLVIIELIWAIFWLPFAWPVAVFVLIIASVGLLQVFLRHLSGALSLRWALTYLIVLSFALVFLPLLS